MRYPPNFPSPCLPYEVPGSSVFPRLCSGVGRKLSRLHDELYARALLCKHRLDAGDLHLPVKLWEKTASGFVPCIIPASPPNIIFPRLLVDGRLR